MSWLTRFANVFRQERLNDELDEELAAHLEEAVERGRPTDDARRALGSPLHHREQSRDVKLWPRLDALTADVVFGWRQLRKRPAATAAAVLSLGLAIGATTAVFRLVDAVLVRKLPVAHPEQLSYLTVNYTDRDGRPAWDDDFDYPTFVRWRDLVGSRADLMVVGVAAPQDVAVDKGVEPERIRRQFVSGNVFGVFGLQPALGRLLTASDDVTPGGHPVVVLSYPFWSRRFGRDPSVLGRNIRIGGESYQIIGVGPKEFIGTETGEMTDVFLPSMANARAIHSAGWSWFRIWLRPRAGSSPEEIRQILQADLLAMRQESTRQMDRDTPRATIDALLRHRVSLRPAASGASELQRNYQRPLLILAALVALVLLVACVNVANLMSAQATARSREMALRVSIGAGRARLAQLILVECGILSLCGSALGAAFAEWSAPFVVSMLRIPQDPVRLALGVGWRELGFGMLLAVVVTAIFGLGPALRASRVHPSAALKGGADPHARRRSMYAMLAAQMAFCMLVQFVAGLFVTTFQRLSNRPLGFDARRLAVLDSSSQNPETPEMWQQVADALRRTPGVESVAMASWNPLSKNRWTTSVRVRGRGVEPKPPYCMDVSPGYFAAMGTPLIDGRELRADDMPPHLVGASEPAAGVGIVNEAFARAYFGGRDPVGQWLDMREGKDLTAPMQIVGYVRDSVYADLREPMKPTVYIPQIKRNGTAFLVRTASEPAGMLATLRGAVGSARPGFRVRSAQAESGFLLWQTLRERLLAALSSFFAVVALVLAAVGLYGTMSYAVAGRRREIGIRMALGARAGHVVKRLAAAPLTAVCAGLAAGLGGGLAGAAAVKALLYEVKASDADMLTLPALMLLGAALIAAVPAAVRAVRIDPAQTLRSE
jgi:putative ABC transport system permease protein